MRLWTRILLSSLCPKLVLKMNLHEFQIRVHTQYCYLQDYEISSDLEVELHVYFHIFMPIAVNFIFWVELSLITLSSMNFMMFWHELDARVTKPKFICWYFKKDDIWSFFDKHVFKFLSKIWYFDPQLRYGIHFTVSLQFIENRLVWLQFKTERCIISFHCKTLY